MKQRGDRFSIRRGRDMGDAGHVLLVSHATVQVQRWNPKPGEAPRDLKMPTNNGFTIVEDEAQYNMALTILNATGLDEADFVIDSTGTPRLLDKDGNPVAAPL